MSNANEDIRRRQAFEEYYRMPSLGLSRNRNAYYEWCIKRMHDDPSSRPTIPTTNKSTIYKWAKEDRWDEQCKVRELEAMDRSAKSYEDLRQRGYDLMNMMIVDAVQAIHDIIKSRNVEENVKVRAAFGLLDRVGLSPEKADRSRHTVGTPDEEPIEEPAPPVDGTEEEMIAYLSRRNKEESDG